MSPDNKDEKREQINDVINITTIENIPKARIHRYNTILPQDILDLIALKKRMKRRLQRSRTSYDPNIAKQLRTEIKLLSFIIDERVAIERSAQSGHQT